MDSSLTATFHGDPDLSRTEQAEEFIASKCVGARGGKKAPGAPDGYWTDAARLLVEHYQPAAEKYVPEIIVTQTVQKHTDKRSGGPGYCHMNFFKIYIAMGEFQRIFGARSLVSGSGLRGEKLEKIRVLCAVRLFFHHV
jgi:hypothetical protein